MPQSGKGRIIALTAIVIAICLLLPSSARATSILNIRHWSAPDHTRVVVDTDDDALCDDNRGPGKVTLTFRNASFEKDLPFKRVLDKPGLRGITVSALPERTIQVELTLAEGVEVRIFKLKEFQDKPYRVVVDIELPAIEKKESQARKQIKSARKAKIVVIDPGHGGDDPGAVGRRGTYEKTVVLDIARKLRDILNRSGNYQAFLTREGDYYLSFRKRLNIAREYGADLFVSIHADAARNRRARGSSVYCLSNGAATSEAARLLAYNENLADIIGGSPDDEINPEESGAIILSMCQTNTINQSRGFADKFIARLEGIGQLKFRNAQAAPFAVLKLPEIPSLLVETAYISNPEEETLLRSQQGRKKIARALALAVGDCLAAGPVDAGSVSDSGASRKPVKLSEGGRGASPRTAAAIHVVRRGDSLTKIASKHHTTVGNLLKLNGINFDAPLLVGQRLCVRAGAGKDDKGEKGSKVKRNAVGDQRRHVTIYRVKKGDTLSEIAKRFKTSVEVLMGLNHMKCADSLYVDQKLKLPRNPS
ncbi:MAG: N-acetylmuramoyl-L-alanine amidase [Deltaproteobacteria bacterium]|nr:N-acetylmuramoyl-L-alanine amidase [Deltaproteobacteria bacterium]